MEKIIENNIPIPSISNKANSKHDFHLIGEGQSCLYKGTKRELESIRVCAINYAKRHKINMVTRMLSEGLRVWNVASEKKQIVAPIKTGTTSLSAQLEASGIKPHNPFGE